MNYYLLKRSWSAVNCLQTFLLLAYCSKREKQEDRAADKTDPTEYQQLTRAYTALHFSDGEGKKKKTLSCIPI